MYIPYINRIFFDLFASLGLTQRVHSPTYVPSDSILDLILTIEVDRVGDVEVCPPLARCLHSPIVCSYVFKFQDLLEYDNRSYEQCSWQKGNYTAINHALLDRDWNYEFAFRLVAFCFLTLTQILTTLVEQYVPVTGDVPISPWRVHPPRALKMVQKHAWDVCKDTRRVHGCQHVPNAEALERNRANHNIHNYSIAGRCAYERKLINKVKEAPKLFHSYIQ